MNLLDNWDFTNPVNQRGNTTYTGPDYGPDRWICGTSKPSSSRFILGTNGITLKRNSGDYMTNVHIIQRLESKLLEGKEVTASVLMDNGTIYSGTATFKKNLDNNFFFSIPNIMNVFYQLYDAGDNSTRFQLVINNISEITGTADEFTIKAVKLEYGKVSTLKNDLLGVSYAEELRKCQRYYYATRTASSYSNNATSMRAISNHDNVVTGTIHYPVRMRTIPTITVYSFQGNVGKVNDGANGSELDVTASVYNQGDDSFNQMNLGRSLSEVTSTKEVVFFFTAEADL